MRAGCKESKTKRKKHTEKKRRKKRKRSIEKRKKKMESDWVGGFENGREELPFRLRRLISFKKVLSFTFTVQRYRMKTI